MPKSSAAVSLLPPSTAAALQQLGADLAVARLRRKESLKTWAKRMGVSVPTLMRLEAGEPTVSVAVLATALWLVGRDSALATLASPAQDRGALEMDVREAEELGKERAKASAWRRNRLHRDLEAGSALPRETPASTKPPTQ
jgi:transcriptional regulator with XRE-family HTH domain